MAKKTKEELLKETNAIAAFHGGACLSTTYISAKTKLTFKCCVPEHPPWEAMPNNIKNGTWCPLCKDKKPLLKKTKASHMDEKLQEIFIIAKGHGGQCLSVSYGNKLIFKCAVPSHRVWTTTAQCIKQGTWCPACAYDASAVPRKIQNESQECTECGEDKPIALFYDKVRKSGRGLAKNAKCIECCVKNQRNLYANNKKTFLLKNYDRREALAQEIDLLKAKPCTDCHVQYEPFCMDFDHIGEKVAAISKMIHETSGLASILKEIEKTELVCVLCHKNRTFKRLQAKENVYSKYKERNLAFILKIKGAPCNICGTKYEHWQMEFDHVSDKKNNISTMVHTGCSLESISEELAKCNLLCALCHRRKTFKERGYRTSEDLNG